LTCLSIFAHLCDLKDEAPPDPRQFAEEVDIVSKISSGFYNSLASSKWKDRKDALDEFHKLLSTSLRVKDSPEFSAICKALAVRMTDSNINCVVSAALCIGSLARALMEVFDKHVSTVMPPMLERLKERKQTVADALGDALDAVFATVRSLAVIHEIIIDNACHLLDDFI
jgi:cytoskeleton-associated protein 5